MLKKAMCMYSMQALGLCMHCCRQHGCLRFLSWSGQFYECGAGAIVMAQHHSLHDERLCYDGQLIYVADSLFAK